MHGIQVKCLTSEITAIFKENALLTNKFVKLLILTNNRILQVINDLG